MTAFDLIDIEPLEFLVLLFDLIHNQLMVVHAIQQANIFLVLSEIRWLLMSLNIIAATTLLFFLFALSIIIDVLELFTQHLFVNLRQIPEILLIFFIHVFEISQTYQIFF